ncbi:MAG: helix-turn-helix domain-containing protein [Lachnospiraceae bacterium]|nr:helix-turn-helix domain-containing protein [Lachnospiraceae bacterium]
MNKNDIIRDTIEIDKTRKNFFYSYDMIFDLDISCHAKCLYMYLCRCADSDNICFPSYKKIAEKCGISSATVKRAIKELMIAGLILKYSSLEGKGSNRYVIYSEPNDSIMIKNVELGNIKDTDLPKDTPESLEIEKNDNDDIAQKNEQTTTSSVVTQTTQNIGGGHTEHPSTDKNTQTTTSSVVTQTTQDIGVVTQTRVHTDPPGVVTQTPEGILNIKEYIFNYYKNNREEPDEDFFELIENVFKVFQELLDISELMSYKEIYRINQNIYSKDTVMNLLASLDKSNFIQVIDYLSNCEVVSDNLIKIALLNSHKYINKKTITNKTKNSNSNSFKNFEERHYSNDFFKIFETINTS